MTRVSTARPIPFVAASPQTAWWARLVDHLELVKPRIVALELVTVAVAAYLASPHGLDALTLLHAIVGTAMVAASAGAMNQWWERSSDARMLRTACRPLPAGRLSARQAWTFSMVLLVLGAVELLVFVRPLTSAIAVMTWLLYILVYTPLKSRSPLNTVVGAVGGALPILIGWTATDAPLGMSAAALVAGMFLWQFPHFMAIAWLYRSDYQRAGQPMLTVVDPTGLRAGAQAIAGALALLPVSLIPALSPDAGSSAIYCMWTVLLGLGLVLTAILFALYRDERSARWLLRSSLLYLVAWMGLLVIVAV